MSTEQELELLTRELHRDPPQPAGIGIEEIRPNMSEADKSRALDEILRVLRGGE